jgi:hypothetical protein
MIEPFSAFSAVPSLASLAQTRSLHSSNDMAVQDDLERLRWLKKATEVPVSVAELALKTGHLHESKGTKCALRSTVDIWA